MSVTAIWNLVHGYNLIVVNDNQNRQHVNESYQVIIKLALICQSFNFQNVLACFTFNFEKLRLAIFRCTYLVQYPIRLNFFTSGYVKFNVKVIY